MRIVLCGINAKYIHVNPAIFTLKNRFAALISSDITNPGSIPEILFHEFTINDPFRSVFDSLAEYRGDIYLFSVYIWNSDIVERCVRELNKLYPDALYLLGGPGAAYNIPHWRSLFPTDTFPGVHILKGPAEMVPEIFIQSIQKGSTAGIKTDIKNRLHRDSTPSRKPAFAFPYTTDDAGRIQNRILYYETSRGCPFRCSYCLSGNREEQYAEKDLNSVDQELEMIARFNPRVLKFVDRTFNLDSSRARHIWNRIVTLDLPFPTHFEIHPAYLTNEDFQFLQTVPEETIQFEVGVQSIHQAVRKAINRTGRWEDEKRNILKIKQETVIPVHADVIIGLPEQTRDMAEETLNELLSLDPEEIQWGFLKILPGTAMEAAAKSHRYLYCSHPPYEVYRTPWMNAEEIRFEKKRERALRLVYNNPGFRTLEKVLRNSYVSGGNAGAQMYGELGDFFYEQNQVTRQWEPLAEILLQWNREKGILEKEYCTDLLRWDWCFIANAHRYPRTLYHPDDRTLKKVRREILERYRLTGAAANRAILYKPFSDEMKTWLVNHLAGYHFIDQEYVLFVNGAPAEK